MKHLFAWTLGAALWVGLAAPAFAAWDNIGSVDISYRPDREIKSTSFGGSIEALQLRAEGSGIYCRSIRAVFGNGKAQQIFSGNLREGRSVGVDLAGRDRNVRQLEFNCKADQRRGGTIRIAADIGRYRGEWRKSPDWDRTWARMFNWGSDVANNWILLGSESFEGRRDSESVFAGWKGQRVDTIALKPLEADARCTSVTATFGNGKSQRLALNGGDTLRRGYFNGVDLPGDQRNVTRLSLRCQPVGAGRVTIQIFTSK